MDILNFELLDKAIKSSETTRIKELLQETKEKINSISKNELYENQYISEFINFEEIKDNENLVDNYYEMLKLEKILNPFFDLQGQIEKEELEPTENEKQYLQKIMKQASNIGLETSKYQSEIFKKRPNSITAKGFNFLEMFKSIQ